MYQAEVGEHGILKKNNSVFQQVNVIVKCQFDSFTWAQFIPRWASNLKLAHVFVSKEDCLLFKCDVDSIAMFLHSKLLKLFLTTNCFKEREREREREKENFNDKNCATLMRPFRPKIFFPSFQIQILFQNGPIFILFFVANSDSNEIMLFIFDRERMKKSNLFTRERRPEH